MPCDCSSNYYPKRGKHCPPKKKCDLDASARVIAVVTDVNADGNGVCFEADLHAGDCTLTNIKLLNSLAYCGEDNVVVSNVTVYNCGDIDTRAPGPQKIVALADLGPHEHVKLVWNIVLGAGRILTSAANTVTICADAETDYKTVHLKKDIHLDILDCRCEQINTNNNTA